MTINETKVLNALKTIRAEYGDATFERMEAEDLDEEIALRTGLDLHAIRAAARGLAKMRDSLN